MKLPGFVLNEPIKDLDGKPFARPTSQTTSEDVTVRYAIRFALVSPEIGQDGRPAQESHEKKFECYELADKINRHDVNKNLELTSKEVTLIEEKALKAWSTEVYGYLYRLLEGKLGYAPYPEVEPEAEVKVLASV